MITLIDKKLLDDVCAEAAASPRRRKNRNFHQTLDYPCGRLLNALQTDSYVVPHRHLDPSKDETFVVVRGSLGMVVFDDAGKVLNAVRAGEGSEVVGFDVPHGVWHSVVALTPDTVFLEAKAGPYQTITPNERADWAPAEGDAGAAAYLERLRALFV